MATASPTQLITPKHKPHKLIRQISIEPPLHINDECIIYDKVPVPEVPPTGARIKVMSVGVCFRRSITDLSTSTIAIPSSISAFDKRKSSLEERLNYESEMQLPKREKKIDSSTLHIPGVKNAALFAGYEIAGIIDKIGKDVQNNNEGLKSGDRVIVYPYDTAPSTYSDYISVPELIFLIPIPDEMPFNIAAMLPTGGLLAMTAAKSAYEIIEDIDEGYKSDTTYKILIVGTGGLASWTYRLAKYFVKNSKFANRIDLYIACLSAEENKFEEEIDIDNVIEWQEGGRDIHNKVYEEKELVAITKEKCGGPLNVVINFGTIARTLLRSLRCLKEGGAVFISDEFHSVLLPKFFELGKKMKINIFPVSVSGIDSLTELVKIVAAKQIKPPPHEVFEIDELRKVVQMLCQSQVNGRAIIKFNVGE